MLRPPTTAACGVEQRRDLLRHGATMSDNQELDEPGPDLDDDLEEDAPEDVLDDDLDDLLDDDLDTTDDVAVVEVLDAVADVVDEPGLPVVADDDEEVLDLDEELHPDDVEVPLDAL